MLWFLPDKWFDEDKGYGFIERAHGAADAFVHKTAVESAGITLNEGDVVSFDVESSMGKTQAVNLKKA